MIGLWLEVVMVSISIVFYSSFHLIDNLQIKLTTRNKYSISLGQAKGCQCFRARVVLVLVSCQARCCYGQGYGNVTIIYFNLKNTCFNVIIKFSTILGFSTIQYKNLHYP